MLLHTFTLLQLLTSCFGPPVVAIFVLALFVEGISERGAFWGMITGHVIGLAYFILHIVYKKSSCVEGGGGLAVLTEVCTFVLRRQQKSLQMSYLTFGGLLFLLIVLLVPLISMMKPPSDTLREQMRKFMYKSSPKESTLTKGYHRCKS